MLSSTFLSDQTVSATKTDHVLVVIEHEIYDNGAFALEGLSFTCVSFELAMDTVKKTFPGIILIMADFNTNCEEYIRNMKKYASDHKIPFILYSAEFNMRYRDMAFRFGFDDYYCERLTQHFMRKIRFIQKSKTHISKIGAFRHQEELSKQKMWLLRRSFDIIVSATMLLMFAPLLLLIALLIKLESKGPVFYISKRAGNNYRIFDFYKFRSMFNDADTKRLNLVNQNQYGQGAFFKIKNDPRVTRFGSFLRKTSLDELPQFINVLKGDMSLVGNRPLPLYEAELLTKDQMARRFLAPAGITGLWQITKRGRDNMSEEERIQLDMEYAKNCSFSYDLKILMGTIPALMQKEPV